MLGEKRKREKYSKNVYIHVIKYELWVSSMNIRGLSLIILIYIYNMSMAVPKVNGPI